MEDLHIFVLMKKLDFFPVIFSFFKEKVKKKLSRYRFDLNTKNVTLFEHFLIRNVVCVSISGPMGVRVYREIQCESDLDGGPRDPKNSYTWCECNWWRKKDEIRDRLGEREQWDLSSAVPPSRICTRVIDYRYKKKRLPTLQENSCRFSIELHHYHMPSDIVSMSQSPFYIRIERMYMVGGRNR